MKIELKNFKPCSEHCPAVTGTAYGSVEFCPMESEENYKKHREDDNTECCANFQCCIDRWQESGLLSVMHNLVEGVPSFGVTEDGDVIK